MHHPATAQRCGGCGTAALLPPLFLALLLPAFALPSDLSCAALEKVLLDGQSAFSSDCGTRQLCDGDKAIDLQKHCRHGCKCVQLPVCADSSSQDSCSHWLETLAARHRRLQHGLRCRGDEECSYPHGRCTAGGLCECEVNTTGEGVSYGSYNCSHPNYPSERTVSGPFAEQSYERHYARLQKLHVLKTTTTSKPMSGPGSSIEATLGVRTALPILVEKLSIRTILDVPCGDFNYMRTVVNSSGFRRKRVTVRYIGADLVRPLVDALNNVFRREGAVEFTVFDLAVGVLWPVDLIIVRDVLFHFSPERVLHVLDAIARSGSRYLLTTTFPNSSNARAVQNFSAGRGFGSFWTVNLQDEPFNLPPPILAIGHDGGARFSAGEQKRVMGLWSLPRGSGGLFAWRGAGRMVS